MRAAPRRRVCGVYVICHDHQSITISVTIYKLYASLSSPASLRRRQAKFKAIGRGENCSIGHFLHIIFLNRGLHSQCLVGLSLHFRVVLCTLTAPHHTHKVNESLTTHSFAAHYSVSLWLYMRRDLIKCLVTGTNNGTRDYLRAHVQNRQTGHQQSQQQQQQMRPQSGQLIGQGGGGGGVGGAMMISSGTPTGQPTPGTPGGGGGGGGPGMLSPQQQQQQHQQLPPGTSNIMNNPDMFFELTPAGEK